MKERNFFRERLFPVIFMFLLTVVFIGGISAIYLSTEDVVLLNETIALKKAVLYVADIPVPDANEEVLTLFDERVLEVDDGAYFEVVDSAGGTESFVAYASGAGLWGAITALVGLEEDLETITGIEFLEQNETPGLGARITEDWFKEQFRGVQGPFNRLTSEEDGRGNAGPNEFDAITGATRTSKAVQGILNQGVAEARALIGGGN